MLCCVFWPQYIFSNIHSNEVLRGEAKSEAAPPKEKDADKKPSVMHDARWNFVSLFTLI